MNTIDKKKMLEGALYNFHFEQIGHPDNQVMDVLIKLKEVCKEANIAIMADDYGRIKIVNRDNMDKTLAITLII